MATSKNIDRALSGPIIPTLFSLTIPLFLGSLLQSAYQIIDAYWVGKLGADAVAAVSVSFPITFFIISAGAGFATAGAVFISQYSGKKDFSMVNHVAGQTILLVVFLSILLGAIGFFLSPTILHLMKVDEAVFAGALSFLQITFIGLIFTFGFSMFQSLMRGVGEVKLPLYIIAGSVCLNFFFDPLFINGWGIIPAMGVSGAALATLATQFLASVVASWILLSGKFGIQIRLSHLVPDFSYIKRAFLLGFPSSIEMSMRSLSMVLMTFLITSFGTIAIASYGAGSNIIQLIMIPAMAVSMATSTLVGQNIGAKNINRAEEIARVSSSISFLFFTGVGVLVFFTAPALVRFFIPEDQSVIDGGAVFLRTIAPFFGFFGLQMALTGTFRASGNMVTPLILTLVSSWVIQFPFAYLFAYHTNLGISGVWYSFSLSYILTAIITLIIFFRGDWKKKTITEENPEQREAYQEANLGDGAH